MFTVECKIVTGTHLTVTELFFFNFSSIIITIPLAPKNDLISEQTYLTNNYNKLSQLVSDLLSLDLDVWYDCFLM